MGDRPGADRVPDQQLYDNLQSSRGPLLEGLDTSRLSGEAGRAQRPAAARRRPRNRDLAWRANNSAPVRPAARPTRPVW